MTEAVRHGGDEFPGAAMAPVAASLRWSRPDLTAALAEHVAEGAAAVDPGLWLVAAGWLAHGRAVTGDSRTAVVEVLEGLRAAGADLAGPDGLRLVVEVAAACQDNGDTTAARRLAQRALDGAAGSAELRLDARLVLLRCAAAANEPWSAVSARVAEARHEAAVLAGAAPTAAVALVEAAAARAAGQAVLAVEAATRGLRALDVDPEGTPHGRTVSEHLVEALTAHRIAALLESGNVAVAREMAARVAAWDCAGRATKQKAQLRLVIARATAADQSATEAALTEAATVAAEADVPGIEGACRSALAELAERSARLEIALGAMRAAVAAEQRDQDRGRRLRDRVAEFESALEATPVVPSPTPRAAPAPAAQPEPTPAPERAVAPERTAAQVQAGRSTIDALLDGLDAGIVADMWSVGMEPLAEPRPALRRRRAAPEPASAPEVVSAPAPPVREKRRTMATAVPIDEAQANGHRPESAAAGSAAGSPSSGHRPAPSYGALLGDSLMSELRASGRWNDDDQRWPQPADLGEKDLAASESSPARTGNDAPAAAGGRAARRRAREEEALRATESGSGTVTRPAEAAPASEAAPVSETVRRIASASAPEAVGRAASASAPEVLGRVAPAPEPLGPVVAAPVPEASAAGREADDWLRSAIAEIDRIWGRPEEPRAADSLGADPLTTALALGAEPGRAEGAPAVGVSVVLDLVDGDRRVHSAEAERVARGLADRMRVHLPARGRVREADPVTVVVDLPGRDVAGAEEWLRPVLGDLAAHVDAPTVLWGVQLRGTVYDTDGAIGLPFLQQLVGAAAAGSHGPRQGSVRVEDLGLRPGEGRRRRRTESEELTVEPAAPSPAPAVTLNGTGPGRPVAVAPSPDAGAAARMPAADAPPQAAADELVPGVATPNGSPTTGADGREPGLGDLLAGAMAAYRGL